jgi:GNAT superfamily N-acetyltransferase
MYPDGVSDYRIRRAIGADAAVIARHRVEMFRAMGITGALDQVEAATRARLSDQLESGEYAGWLVEHQGLPVAGAGVLLHQYYPSVTNPRGRPTAYILNVFTEPAHRRRGLARRLVEAILTWCTANDIARASLHASDAGRPVYEQLGFAATNELRIELLSA